VFGHYLLHRAANPNGIRCNAQDVVRWDSAYGQIEHQANQFAATLLMPLDDFRRQIDPRTRVDLDMISQCAGRYRVSLIAAILRWLVYTERRAVLVVSRDDFILWSRASEPAAKTGAVFRTSGGPIVHYLTHIGYYRLSGYALPFQIGGSGPLRAKDFKNVVRASYI
jgi:IrrE N-terminal-like domain